MAGLMQRFACALGFHAYQLAKSLKRDHYRMECERCGQAFEAPIYTI